MYFEILNVLKPLKMACNQGKLSNSFIHSLCVSFNLKNGSAPAQLQKMSNYDKWGSHICHSFSSGNVIF